LHWVWNEELGWYAFGTRRDRFDFDEKGIAEFNKAHPGLEDAATLFQKSYQFLTPYKYTTPSDDKEVTFFTEFLGDNSFAGTHQKDDPKRLVLLDASIMLKGKQYIAPPSQFALDFGYFDDEPDNPCIYDKKEGFHFAKYMLNDKGFAEFKYSGQLIEDIRNGKFPVKEGCVIKGVVDGQVYMIKVKTNKYLEKLKEVYQDTWEDYWE
jgi:hypothetical protein